MKPKKSEAIDALEILLRWATGNGSSRGGNPYAVPEIKHALGVIARERGMSASAYLDVELRQLPIPS